MNIKVNQGLPKKVKNSCLLVAANGTTLSVSAKSLNSECGGLLKKLQKNGDITGKSGECVTLLDLPGSEFDRAIVVGFGAADSLDRTSYLRILGLAFRAARKTGAATVISTLTEVSIKAGGEAESDFSPDSGSGLEGDFGTKSESKKQNPEAYAESWKLNQQARIHGESAYQFDGHKTSKAKKSENSPPKKQAAILVCSTLNQRQGNAAAKNGAAVASGTAVAKDLGNLAANICTPSYLATLARQYGRKSEQLKVSVLGEKQMEKLGMGAFLAVSRGSRQEGKLIVMEYRGASKSSKPVVILGKGITFDTGGISIKPSAAMDEMKFDMCGAASVFGTLATCLELKLKRNIIFVVAAAENMPDGDAVRPGDVVESMSGKTIEILNTDAEGRLVLCDALTYINRYKPAAVIDIATLTGACVVALGGVATGLMSNNRELTNQLLSASTVSGDKAWELPLWDDYRSQLDSNFADLGNIGGRTAGAITAGVFLKQFATAYPWAHLDIAGTGWLSGRAKGATGRPVALLTQYLLDN